MEWKEDSKVKQKLNLSVSVFQKYNILEWKEDSKVKTKLNSN